MNALKLKTRHAAFAVGLLALIAGGQEASAQQPSPAAIGIAKEILVVKQATGIYEGAVVNLISQNKSTLMQTNINYQKDLDEVALKIASDLKGRESEIADQMAKIYASGFTEAELRDLLSFYKSPLGRKSIVQEPKAIQEGMAYLNDWAAKFSEDVITRFRVEMKKRGKDI